MVSFRTLDRRRIAGALGLAAAVASCGTLAVAAGIKDAKVGTYTRWGADKVNIRLDKIERVEHADGDATKGYTILSFSIQNTGNPSGVREAGITEIFDDESQLDGHSRGPYTGKGTTYFNAHLEHLQTVHVRYLQLDTPADRKITKIILDPNDGGPKLRYSIDDATIPRVDEPAAAK